MMTTDLETQLRAYGYLFAAEIEPVTYGDAVVRRVGEGRVQSLDLVVPAKQYSGRRSLWVAAATFTLIVVVGITLGIAFGRDGAVGDPVSQPVAASVTAPVTAPTVDAAGWCAFGNEVNRHILAIENDGYGEILPPSEWVRLLDDWAAAAPPQVSLATGIVGNELKSSPADFSPNDEYSQALKEIQALRRTHCESGEIPSL